jgi:flagellar basal-body rod protein FlgC
MSDGFYSSTEVSASGLSAERLAMDVIANNIANASTTRTPQGGSFKRQLVVFAQKADVTDAAASDEAGNGMAGVSVEGIISDQSPDRMVFDPTHPDADARGYVHMPNIQVVKEMVDLMTASRAYEANVTAIQEARQMDNSSMNILKA